MQNENAIVTATSGLARRMNVYNVSRLISVSMIWGAGAAMVFVIISKFVPTGIPIAPVPSTFAAAGILGAAFIAGMVRGIQQRVSALEAAITADAGLGLKERLGSALEILKEENRREMAELQLEDAADYALLLDQKAMYPRMFPMTAKLLPVVLLILAAFMYILSPYGRADRVPPEVRQAVKQAGAEMEKAVEGMDKEPLLDEVDRLAQEMKKTGRELQDKPLSKKEALRNLSNLARKMEALKLMGEMAERLGNEMTPERRRELAELLRKLAGNLKDIPEMAELFDKVLKAQQANLSAESLEELAAALEQTELKASDVAALQRMMEQLAKEKWNVGQAMVRSPRTSGGNEPSDLKAEEESGLMGSGAPGKKAAKDMAEEIEQDTRRPITSSQGYDSELDGQLSETGMSVPTGDEMKPETGESSVPYAEVYVQYRDAADSAIARPEIPWMYKEHVKNYFDAIRPEE